MKFNFILLKQISVLSALFGAMSGFVTLFPFLGIISFIFVLCLIAPIVVWLLIKYNCIAESSAQDGILIGAIAGFVGYLAFSIIYVPVSIIIIKIFNYSANVGVGILLNNANLFLLLITSIFLGVVGATLNAFTGFLTFYVIEFVNSLKK